MRVAFTGAKSPTNAGVAQSGARFLVLLVAFCLGPPTLSRDHDAGLRLSNGSVALPAGAIRSTHASSRMSLCSIKQSTDRKFPCEASPGRGAFANLI
jgi:hypothetical protein